MSPLPPNITRMLYSGGDWVLPGDDGQECEGAAFHSPRPLFTQNTRLVLREWWPEPYAPDSDGVAHWVWAPTANLCGTCRDNLSILLQLMHATNGELEWEVRREFGNSLRALATKGWRWFSDRRPAPAAEATP